MCVQYIVCVLRWVLKQFFRSKGASVTDETIKFMITLIWLNARGTTLLAWHDIAIIVLTTIG
jgi:hypothetical protein